LWIRVFPRDYYVSSVHLQQGLIVEVRPGVWQLRLFHVRPTGGVVEALSGPRCRQRSSRRSAGSADESSANAISASALTFASKGIRLSAVAPLRRREPEPSAMHSPADVTTPSLQLPVMARESRSVLGTSVEVMPTLSARPMPLISRSPWIRHPPSLARGSASTTR